MPGTHRAVEEHDSRRMAGAAMAKEVFNLIIEFTCNILGYAREGNSFQILADVR